MASADAFAQEHLILLLRTSRLLSSTLDVQQVLETLMSQVVEVLGAERGFILVREEVDQDWQFRTVCALDAETMATEDFKISRGLADRVAREGKSILTSDALQDERFKRQASVGLYNLRSILCVPININDRILGVIYVDHRLSTGAFDGNAQLLLEAIASQAAIALENALLVEKLRRVYESSLEQARHELAETQAQLLHSSKMAAVGQLAAGVAHEINNPLGAISLSLTGMKSTLGEHPAQARIRLCESALQRCQAIVQRLLTFSRKRDQPEGRFDLGEVLTSTLQLVEPDLRLYQIRVTPQVEPDLILCGDAGEMSQVFLNLFLNARDALAARAETESRSMWVRGRRQEKTLQIEVVDNGPGMAPETRARIFEPFFTTKPVGQGVGLGLSICYQIVRQHGGEIAVESRPGEGTRFILTFPAT